MKNGMFPFTTDFYSQMNSFVPCDGAMLNQRRLKKKEKK